MRIVGSLTTIPSRINSLIPTLLSLSTQTVPLDQIYLVIPRVSNKETAEYKIPTIIYSYAKIIIVNKDYGPITKLIGPLDQENDPDTRIITFDDDIIYPENLVEYLLKKSSTQPNSAIGTAGIRIGSFPSYLSFATNYDNSQNHWYNFKPSENGDNVDILAGYAGNLFKRRFFPITTTEIINHAFEELDVFKNDDVLISSYLSKAGVPRIVYPGPSILRREISYNDGLSNNLYNFVRSAYSAIKFCERKGLLSERVNVQWWKTVTGPFAFGILVIIMAIIIYKCSIFSSVAPI